VYVIIPVTEERTETDGADGVNKNMVSFFLSFFLSKIKFLSYWT